MKNIATQLEKSAVSVPRYGIGLSEKKIGIIWWTHYNDI